MSILMSTDDVADVSLVASNPEIAGIIDLHPSRSKYGGIVPLLVVAAPEPWPGLGGLCRRGVGMVLRCF